MSYDITIAGESFNYTYNLGPLFHAHIQHNEKTGLQALNGLTGKQGAKVLADAFDRISAERDRLFRDDSSTWSTCVPGDDAIRQKYDPENGWGSYITALHFLMRLMAECVRNPRAKMEVF